MPQRPKAMQRKLRAVLTCLLLVSLIACSGRNSMDDLQQYIIETSLRPGGPVEPMPEFLPYEAFAYSAATMRSPFDVPIMAGANEAKAPTVVLEPDFNRPQEPLEAFALANLNMVGMMMRDKHTVALVQDENGMIHRVTEGAYMGRNHGRVVSVTGSEIELIEIVPSGDGGWVERPRTLTLVR